MLRVEGDGGFDVVDHVAHVDCGQGRVPLD
jgi:hypothetical protein